MCVVKCIVSVWRLFYFILFCVCLSFVHLWSEQQLGPEGPSDPHGAPLPPNKHTPTHLLSCEEWVDITPPITMWLIHRKFYFPLSYFLLFSLQSLKQSNLFCNCLETAVVWHTFLQPEINTSAVLYHLYIYISLSSIFLLYFSAPMQNIHWGQHHHFYSKRAFLLKLQRNNLDSNENTTT